MRPLTLDPAYMLKEILKFKIAPHKQKSIVKKVFLAERWTPPWLKHTSAQW